MNLSLFKSKKGIFIIVAVFLLLFVLMIFAAIDEDDEWEEMNTKFPLEDYLFTESQKKLKEYEQRMLKEQEQEREKINQMKQELERMKEEMKKANEQRNNIRENIRDKNGNVVALDESGNPILYNSEGKQIFYDENGRPYTLNENGERVYMKEGEKIYSSPKASENNEIEVDESGFPILYQNGENSVDGSNGGSGKNFSKNPQGNALGLKDYQQGKEPVPPEEQNPNYLYDEDGYYIGDAVAKENQKFIYEKADDKQRKINNILASRFNKKEPKVKEIDYGVDEFENFDEKDEASNEHRLLRTITADKLIPAFLVRPISSQIAGNVVAQVESNIYGAMGRAVLIPKGSKVIGFYESNNKIGEYRLQVVWTRIITPHGVNILLTEAKSADVKGYNGLVGKVHSRNFERYGIPLTLSTLSNGLLLYVNSLSNKSSAAQSSGNTNSDLMSLYAQSQIMSGMRQDISQIINRIIQEQVKIQPIITVREGSRIFIAPSVDIFIPVPKKNEAVARFFRQKKQPKEEESDE